MNQLRILALGDIVGRETVAYLGAKLWKYRKEQSIDLTVANVENACMGQGNGLTPDLADAIKAAGVDLLTSGNHIWQQRSLYSYLDQNADIARPCNYPSTAPGFGFAYGEANGVRVMAVNVMGVVFGESLADPFDSVAQVLQREEGRYDIALLDIHAEATSEKAAIARFFDGRFCAIFGTHTHVQTADARILPRGSGYLTDLGMCGPTESILGVKTECILERFRSKLPLRFAVAEGEIAASGAIFTVDADSGRCLSVELARF